MLKELALENFWTPSFSKAKKQAVKSAKAKSPARYWLSVGLIAVNAFLLLSYIYGVNQFAASGYEIKTLQTKLAALDADNKQINLQVSEASSMVEIQSDFLSSNFVAAGTPKFLLSNGDQFTER